MRALECRWTSRKLIAAMATTQCCFHSRQVKTCHGWLTLRFPTRMHDLIQIVIFCKSFIFTGHGQLINAWLMMHISDWISTHFEGQQFFEHGIGVFSFKRMDCQRAADFGRGIRTACENPTLSFASATFHDFGSPTKFDKRQ
jgi:hypothetical protein